MSNSLKNSKITLSINDLEKLLEKAFVAGYESPEELMKEEVTKILHSAQCTVESIGSIISDEPKQEPSDRIFSTFHPESHIDQWRKLQGLLDADDYEDDSRSYSFRGKQKASDCWGSYWID